MRCPTSLAAAFRRTFPGFCLAAFLLGWAAAAGHQYRFAALEQVPAEQAPKATSVLLLGGILLANANHLASLFLGIELISLPLFGLVGYTAARKEVVEWLRQRSRPYLFSNSLLLTIARESNQQIIQQIDLSGSHFETGGLVHTKLDANQQNAEEAPTQQRSVVALQRAEVAELNDGVRGYRESAKRVQRSVSFRFVGFPEADAPNWNVKLGARGALMFGRSSREAHPEHNPAPMDVSLRAYLRDGSLDRDASTRVSRHHFDLLVLNERLVLHARSGKGALVNGREVPSGAVVPIEDGDIIAPAKDVANAIAMRARFRAGQHEHVDEIELIRES